MQTQTLIHRDIHIIEALSQVLKPDDALDLIAACAELGSHLLLLDSPALSEPFLDLRTRVAGEFLQKLQNYRLHTAGVFPTDREYTERLKEFLIEAKHGQSFRAFTSRPEALDWLASA